MVLLVGFGDEWQHGEAVPDGRADRDGLNQITVVAACEMNRTVGHPFWVVGCGVLRWLVWREPKECVMVGCQSVRFVWGGWTKI
jgi:hypothetical protein